MKIENIYDTNKFHFLAGLLIAISTLLAYSNTFNASFHFDDVQSIVENYNIRSLDKWTDIVRGHRGLAMITFAINYAIGGLDVTGYHVVNTVIHIINSILIYSLVFITLNGMESFRRVEKKIALFTALLFALHPIQTQAVTYIVQRMEIMSSMFMIIGLILFIQAAKASTIAVKALLYMAVAVSFIFGFYTKEIAITLPALIVLYDYCFLSKGNIKELIGRWPVYIALIALLIFLAAPTFSGLQETPGSAVEVAAGSFQSAGFGVESITPKEYLFTQFNVILYYVSLLLVPVNQNLDYDFPISKGLFEVPVVSQGTILNIPLPPPILSLLVIAAAIVFAIYLLTHNVSRITNSGRLIAFFIFWFFIVLSPTSSILPIIDVIFEHRLYLASAGFFFLFSLSLESLFKYFEMRKVKVG